MIAKGVRKERPYDSKDGRQKAQRTQNPIPHGSNFAFICASLRPILRSDSVRDYSPSGCARPAAAQVARPSNWLKAMPLSCVPSRPTSRAGMLSFTH